MPTFDLQGTRCQRPEGDADCGTEKPLVKPHIITAQGSRAATPPGLKRDVGRFARLTSLLASDERLVQERAEGIRVGLYRLYGELGSGNSATVRLAVHQLTTERVAVKVLDRAKLDHKKCEMLTEEVASMERLHHPNIIRLYEVVESPRHIHLMMEYAPAGDLERRVSREGPLTEADARSVFSQLLAAVQHMHSKKLVHRDIKAENVFFASRSRVKLGDLGFSRRVSGIGEHLTQFCGSPSYSAPELLSAASYRGDRADLWALGVLLFFSVTGRLPFDGASLAELRRHILAVRYRWPAGVGSEPCRELVAALLQRDPAARPSAAEAGRCRWLNGHPPPAAGRSLSLRAAPVTAQEREARARLRQLGVSETTLESHRRRGCHSPVTGLYRMVLHRVCREEEESGGSGKQLWLRGGDRCKQCTIL
ncbi:serine/threonine-protein kinase NIM1-like [Amphibalanus amphitrite]|uniref:serine/threonine-protein kinase NIM1-like n=1 Tax=Amphibalanus amphitrite TaxID=1232801 RepID=UPI001C920D30|nr:serine/threonine-protein kinase NIM1-like [Amphibalanus amphitrite]